MEPIKYTPHAPRPRTSLVRWLLVFIGTLALSVGAIGVLVPGLPTTPFVLIAGACYIRSSARLYHWLITNRIFGPVLATWQAERGMTWRTKIITLALVWIMLGSAALFLVESLFMRLVLLSIAGTKTVVLAYIRTISVR